MSFDIPTLSKQKQLLELLKVQPITMGKNKSYNTDILVSLIDEHLPDGGEQWENIAKLYQVKASEENLRNGEDIKRHWVNTLCNKQNKPTGSTGGKTDLILKCQRIQKRILEKSNSRMYGASDIEDLSGDEDEDEDDDDDEIIISESSSSNNPSSQSEPSAKEKSSTSDEKLKSTSKTLFKSENKTKNSSTNNLNAKRSSVLQAMEKISNQLDAPVAGDGQQSLFMFMFMDRLNKVETKVEMLQRNENIVYYGSGADDQRTQNKIISLEDQIRTLERKLKRSQEEIEEQISLLHKKMKASEKYSTI